MFYIIIWNLHAIYCIIDFEQYILYSIYDILQLVHNRKYMTLYSVILWYMYTYMQTCTELQNEPCPPSFCNDADSRMSSNHGVVSPRRWDVLSSHRSCGAQHPETSRAEREGQKSRDSVSRPMASEPRCFGCLQFPPILPTRALACYIHMNVSSNMHRASERTLPTLLLQWCR